MRPCAKANRLLADGFAFAHGKGTKGERNMRINGIYPTYVYNTNRVSAKSLGRVEAIPNDALSGKTGYTSSGENTNPLRPGTSKDFAGIVASQMAMSRMRAARIMRQQPVSGNADEQKIQNDDQNRQSTQAMTQDVQQAQSGEQGIMGMAMLGA